MKNNGTASNGMTYSGFFAPYTKTKTRGEWIYWTCSGCICSVNKAFINHLEVNSDLPVNSPLFMFEMGPEKWELMWQVGSWNTVMKYG